jgi:hypothetical protein
MILLVLSLSLQSKIPNLVYFPKGYLDYFGHLENTRGFTFKYERDLPSELSIPNWKRRFDEVHTSPKDLTAFLKASSAKIRYRATESRYRDASQLIASYVNNVCHFTAAYKFADEVDNALKDIAHLNGIELRKISSSPDTLPWLVQGPCFGGSTFRQVGAIAYDKQPNDYYCGIYKVATLGYEGTVSYDARMSESLKIARKLCKLYPDRASPYALVANLSKDKQEAITAGKRYLKLEQRYFKQYMVDMVTARLKKLEANARL